MSTTPTPGNTPATPDNVKEAVEAIYRNHAAILDKQIVELQEKESYTRGLLKRGINSLNHKATPTEMKWLEINAEKYQYARQVLAKLLLLLTPSAQ